MLWYVIMTYDLFLFSAAVNDMEKKLAEYKCDTNEAVCLKLGKSSVEQKIARIKSVSFGYECMFCVQYVCIRELFNCV